LAKKRIKTEVKPLPTKRQLSRHRRQQRIQRIIYIVGAVFMASLIAFVGYGYWDVQIKPFSQPAAKINGITYDMDYYVKFLNLYSKGQDATQTTATADKVVGIIQLNQALVRSAPEFGVSISSEDVKATLKTMGLPDDKVSQDALEASMLSSRLVTDHFDKEIPDKLEQVNTQAIFVENTDVADKVRQKWVAGDNFTALVDQYSLEPITKSAYGELGWLPKGYPEIILGSLENSALKDVPYTLNAGEISQPIFDGTVSKSIGYWVVQVTEKDPDPRIGSHARGILTGSRKDAEAVREKILAGEDFATLVKNYSQDSTSAAKDGDLGWTGKGEIGNRLVMSLAAPLEAGGVSQPGADTSVKTVGGYWLIKAVERDDNRTLDDNMRQAIRNGLFTMWITEKMKGDSVETLMTDEQKAWAINYVVNSRE
jgi:parvulin-like peptidyl-prolyl isomerase